MANYRHGLSFFQGLANRGRPDLAALNAADDGRYTLAAYYERRWVALAGPRPCQCGSGELWVNCSGEWNPGYCG